MADTVRIDQLPEAVPLDGSELVPVQQDGATRRTDGLASRGYVDSVASNFAGVEAEFDAGATAAEVQSAIDAAGDGTDVRAIILLRGAFEFDDSIDVKRCIIAGVGAPGIGWGRGGTTVKFTGTAGFYSSTEDNYGYELRNMRIEGSGFKATNGQVLVDFTGQNNPRLRDVFIWKSDIGVRINYGATVECNYGTFLNASVQSCRTGWDIAEGRSMWWWGGRQYNNGTAVLGAVGNNWHFTTAFESNDLGIDSSGSNVVLDGSRFENPGGTNLTIRSGAGLHYANGNHWSSGTNVVDENSPTVLRGTDEIVGAIHHEPSTKAIAAGSLSKVDVYDTFDRTDDASSLGSTDDGTAWTQHSGTWGVESGRATETGTAQCFASVEGVGNGWVEVDVDRGVGSNIYGPCFRGVDETEYLFLVWTDTQVRLFKRVSSTNTQLAAFSRTIASETTYRVAVQFIDDEIRVLIDGELAMEHTLSAGDLTEFPTSQLRCGLANNLNSDIHYDNFVVRSA